MENNEKWKVVQVFDGLLGAQDKHDFLNGKNAGLLFKNVIGKSNIQLLNSAINDIGIEYFEGDDKAGSIVRKGKLGPNFYRFKNNPIEYFLRKNKYWPIFENQILNRVDLYKQVRSLATAIFDKPSKTAMHAGEEMMGCTVRDLGVAAIHSDWLPGESLYLDFAKNIRNQMAWNFYLEMPKHGGETLIYNARDINSLSEDTAVSMIKPEVGDLIIFNTQLLHQVMPAQGPRLTLSGFFGDSEDELLFWV